MDKQDFKKMDSKSLRELVALKKNELLKLRLSLSKSQNEGNVKSIKKVRKDLAQFLTIIRKKENHVK